MSKFIKKVLIDAGVSIPIRVCGNGCDHILREERKEYEDKLGKSFRFLHVSSCFPRKGVDVLLRAYFEEFTSQDDVTLVIKTFPNIHNDIENQIKELKKTHRNAPDIKLINKDLSTGYIVDIYKKCHALVAPSRGEGFGLPMAEAMLFGLPVITTGFGGQSDFCTEETAWTVGFRFEKARSHLSCFNSVWAEPDAVDLARIMREVYEMPKEAAQTKLKKAKSIIEREFTWEKTASRVEAVVANITNRKPFEQSGIKLGWVSSWNSKCGIAVYSKHLLDHLSGACDLKILASRNDGLVRADENNVERCWDDLSVKDLSGLET
ncbi:MAG: glycosyltransferase family 4 protein, partial [Pyrinomonadaceae bacterium]